jgi:hypothetical protein
MKNPRSPIFAYQPQDSFKLRGSDPAHTAIRQLRDEVSRFNDSRNWKNELIAPI